MYRICFVVAILFVVGYWCAVTEIPDLFRQDGAKLKYFNPKYIVDVGVFTGRTSRRDPYLTNMTGTIIHPFGNNVTYEVVLSEKSGGDFHIAVKVCESFKHKWMKDFMGSFTNVSLEKCPIPVGRYQFRNMELPPKHIPLPIVNGDYWIKYHLYITATKELIVDIETLLHYENNKKNSKKPKKG